MAALVERGGSFGGEGFLALAGGVDQNSDKENVLACARLLLTIEGEKFNSVQWHGWTSLMHASMGGCEVLVDWLVDKGADLNARDTNGWSALMLSIDRGMVMVASLLLELGADPMIVTLDGWTAEDIAASSGSRVLQDIIEIREMGRLEWIENKSRVGLEKENSVVIVAVDVDSGAMENNDVSFEEMLASSSDLLDKEEFDKQMILEMLPQNFSYKFVNFNIQQQSSKDIKFDLVTRVDVSSEEEVKVFLADLNCSTGCTYNIQSGRRDKKQEGEHSRTKIRGFRKCCLNVATADKKPKQEGKKSSNLDNSYLWPIL